MTPVERASLGGIGPLTNAEWRRVSGLVRLRLTGTGNVSIAARDSLGNVTSSAALGTDYTVDGATDRIEFPFFGINTIEIRAVITGTAIAEII